MTCCEQRRGMVVVTDAAIVITLLREASWPALIVRLVADSERLISVASYIQTGTVLAVQRNANQGRAGLALQVRIRLDRRMEHAGLLDFGNALASTLKRPLLFVRNNCGETDATAPLDPVFPGGALAK